MDANAHVDVLLKMRGEMEQEIVSLRDALAGKQKTLEALNTTIAMVRGWTPKESLPILSRNTYDASAIREAILDIFTENGKSSFPISEICGKLEARELVPPYCNPVRNSVSRIIKLSVEEVEMVGKGPHARYRLKTTHSVNGSHYTSGGQAETHSPAV